MQSGARLVVRSLHQTSLCSSRLLKADQPILQNNVRCNTTFHWSPITKSFHTVSRLEDNVNAESQAHPLGDFYADLLARPIPKESKARTDLPSFVDTGGDATKEERAAKLFGNIKGSGYERRTPRAPDETWQTINGVPIPPRPGEPDNCCMSGCVHCVWDDYRDDIEQWAARTKEAQAKAEGSSNQSTPKIQMNRPEVENASSSMDDDGGGSEGLWQSPPETADELFAGIPIGIREFMNVEKRIRERQRDRKARAAP